MCFFILRNFLVFMIAIYVLRYILHFRQTNKVLIQNLYLIHVSKYVAPYSERRLRNFTCFLWLSGPQRKSNGLTRVPTFFRYLWFFGGVWLGGVKCSSQQWAALDIPGFTASPLQLLAYQLPDFLPSSLNNRTVWATPLVFALSLVWPTYPQHSSPWRE